MAERGTAPQITLGHLYPEHLNLYGDRGNVIALIGRADRHGLRVRYLPVQPGERVNFEAYDILFMGGGQDHEQRMVAADLQGRRAEMLAAVERGLVILAICGSYQLLGQYYAAGNGERIPGLGLLDLYTEAGRRRIIGNIVTRCGLWDPPRTLVGFENHAGLTFLGPAVRPLATVLRGIGNNGRDRTEGAVYRNVVGTYLHGALLPKNPWLTDYLLQKALDCRHPGYVLKPLEHSMEERAHRASVQRALSRRR